MLKCSMLQSRRRYLGTATRPCLWQRRVAVVRYRMRILVTEDDRQLRTAILRGLKEASYDVDQAGTAAQAIGLAAANAYDVMILDVLLPDGDGLAVCRALRQNGNRVP